MSKRGYISRYSLIIQKLRTKPYATFEEIEKYIAHQSKYDDSLSISFSLRTFQRDVKEIYSLYGIDIEYSKIEKGYFISNEAEGNNAQRMMEAFDVFNSLNIAQDLSLYIQLEKRKPQGTEHLYGLLHAIKNKVQIKFLYKSFWEPEIVEHIIEPYALKEFRSRWYIIGNDTKDETIKRFALDRLPELNITNKKFTKPKDFNIEDYYRYCFGVITPDNLNDKPKDILLSFHPNQGNYIKTLPLHETQQIILDNDDELRVKLKMHITHEFLMELLSFGSNVKVLKPGLLIEIIKSMHKDSLALYEDR